MVVLFIVHVPGYCGSVLDLVLLYTVLYYSKIILVHCTAYPFWHQYWNADTRRTYMYCSIVPSGTTTTYTY